MSILDQILEKRKQNVEETKRSVPLSELKARIPDMEETRPFRGAISRADGEPIKLIAEVKKASPSKGLIREDFDLKEIVSVYEKKGVDAISILTEEDYFQGSLNYLRRAHFATRKPLLRKDFIVDEYQLYEARVNHADAVLLITAALGKIQLGDYLGLCSELSLDALVEVHTYGELDRALACGCNIIGINNRDLSTLSIDLRTSLSMIEDIPEDRTIVSESGITSRQDMEIFEATRIDAVLVGTAIMKEEEIGAKIDELRGRPGNKQSV
jgi:indole-3-glycerol phosphate synthase